MRSQTFAAFCIPVLARSPDSYRCQVAKITTEILDDDHQDYVSGNKSPERLLCRPKNSLLHMFHSTKCFRLCGQYRSNTCSDNFTKNQYSPSSPCGNVKFRSALQRAVILDWGNKITLISISRHPFSTFVEIVTIFNVRQGYMYSLGYYLPRKSLQT